MRHEKIQKFHYFKYGLGLHEYVCKVYKYQAEKPIYIYMYRHHSVMSMSLVFRVGICLKLTELLVVVCYLIKSMVYL